MNPNEQFPGGRWTDPTPETSPAVAATEPASMERTEAHGGPSACKHSWFRQQPLPCAPATYKCIHCGAILR
jgi:hypothetical protein